MRRLLAFFTFASCLLSAQEAGRPAPGENGEAPSIKVNVNLVSVSFTVRDPSGNLERDFKAEDFEILEDGVPQPVKFFGRPADLPLRLALLVDGSGSQDKFNRQHHTDLENFLHAALTSRDQAMLLGFASHLREASGFTTSPQELLEALGRYEKHSQSLPELEPDSTRDGGTALFDAICAVAGRRLSQTAGERKAMIVFSDGEDNASAHDVVDAIDAAQTADSIVYAVRYTEMKRGRPSARNRFGKTEMDRLARDTGGTSYDGSRGGVAEQLAHIGEELRAMYEIAYTSSNPERDGSFRKIAVRVRRSGRNVRAKSGYYAR